MESDLPLLEISGEDDSLLLPQQIHTIDADVTSNYFSCSPLQFQGPRPPSTVPPRPSPLRGAEVNLKKLRSFSKDKSNKENDDVKKSEAPRLGMDPQQMKRKKKGGSYNLRKSLAWNNAFFTEEGVLDPFELSLISGTVIESSGEALSAIKEEGCSMPVLESESFKKVASPVVSKSKRVGSATMPKCDSPGRVNLAPRPVATRKVLWTHDVNRSSLKYSGSRPSFSSSQKRPANANTTRVAMRESKLPKLPTANPGSSAFHKVPKGSSLVAAHPNSDQIVQRANVPKMTGFKGSVSNCRNDRSISKATPSDKSRASVQSSKKIMANSLARIPSSSTPKPLVGRVDNDVPKMIPDPKLPLKGSTIDDSTKLAFAVPPNTKRTAGDIPNAQAQSAKPTFLRMPSPSIGYFGQPKASAPQSLPSRTAQACNTIEASTSNSQKLDAIDPISAQKPPHALWRKQKFTLDLATAEKARGSSMSSERHVLTEADTSLSDSARKDVEGHSSKNIEVRVSPQQSSTSILENVEELSQGRPDLYKMEEVSCNVDGKLHVNPSNPLSEAGSCEQLKGVSDQKNVAEICLKVQNPSLEKVTDPHIPSPSSPCLLVYEDNQHNVSIEDQRVTSVLECQDSSSHLGPEICHNLSINLHRTEDETFYFCEADKLPSDEDQRLVTSNHVLFLGTRSSEDSWEYEMEYSNRMSQSLNGCEPENSQSKSQPKSMRKSNEYAVEEDMKITITNLTDVQSSNCNVLIQSCVSEPGDSAVHVLNTMSEGATEQSGELGNCSEQIGVHYAKNGPTEVNVKDKQYQLPVQSCGHLRDVHSGEAMICSNQNASVVIDSANKSHNANTRCDVFEQKNSRTNQADEISHGTQAPEAHDGISVEEGQSCVDFLKPFVGNIAEVGQYNVVSGRKDLDSSLDSSRHICNNQANEGITRADNITQELQIGTEIRSSDSNVSVEGSNLNSVDTFVTLSYVNENTGGRLLSHKPCSFQGTSVDTNLSEGNVPGAEPETDGLSTYEAPLELDTTQRADAAARSMDVDLVEYQIADGDRKSAHDIELIGLATSEHVVISNLSQDQTVRTITHGCFTPLCSCDESQRSAQIDQMSNQSEQVGGEAHSRSDIFLLEPETKSSDHGSSEDQNLQKSRRGRIVSTEYLHANIEDVSLVVPSSDGSSRKNPHGPSRQIYREQGNEGTSMEVTKTERLRAGDTEDRSLEHNLNAVSCCNQSYALEEHETSPKMTNISGKESGSLDQNDQPLANQSLPRRSSVSELQSKAMSEVAETVNCHISTDGNILQKLDNPLSPFGEETMPSKRSGNDAKKDVLTIKLPLNVVPFSDEWLAAMEAAGEDILTLKSGAVQHSPVDKSIPEPSPWSPVRKKNNQAIGPFDCTKHTNAQL